MTLLVHPARQEPLGRVLLEAAATGTAIIATDVGGTREIFPPEGASASLVPPDDAAVLAQEIQRLLDDESERQRLRAAARARISFFVYSPTGSRIRPRTERDTPQRTYDWSLRPSAPRCR